MTRVDTLRALVTDGRAVPPDRLLALAAELELHPADVLVVAGHPVPAELLPPKRDLVVLRDFAGQVAGSAHADLVTLTDYVRAMPRLAPGAATFEVESVPETGDKFPAIFSGLMRNRGMGVRQLPFTGLSVSTIRGMQGGAWHSEAQVRAVSGSLGWRYEDLAAVAGAPLGDWGGGGSICRHVGLVYVAAIPLTTAQLADATIRVRELAEQGAPPDACPGD